MRKESNQFITFEGRASVNIDYNMRYIDLGRVYAGRESVLKYGLIIKHGQHYSLHERCRLILEEEIYGLVETIHTILNPWLKQTKSMWAC